MKPPPKRPAILMRRTARRTARLTRKRKDLEKADGGVECVDERVAGALKTLQLAATATPETAEAQINAIDDMREAAVRINDLSMSGSKDRRDA